MLVSKVIKEALFQVWFKRVRLLKAIAFPFLIYMGLLILNHSTSTPSVAYLVLFSLVSIVAYSLTVICTHRILLLGDESVPEWGIHTFTIREVLFILLVAITEIKPFLLYAVFTLTQTYQLPKISLILFILLMILLITRLCIIFPALAIDKWMSPTQAWKYTKKYQFKILTILIIPSLIFKLLKDFFLRTLASFLHIPIISLLSYVELIIIIATISIAYKEIILLERS